MTEEKGKRRHWRRRPRRKAEGAAAAPPPADAQAGLFPEEAGAAGDVAPEGDAVPQGGAADAEPRSDARGAPPGDVEAENNAQGTGSERGRRRRSRRRRGKGQQAHQGEGQQPGQASSAGPNTGEAGTAAADEPPPSSVESPPAPGGGHPAEGPQEDVPASPQDADAQQGSAPGEARKGRRRSRRRGRRRGKGAAQQVPGGEPSAAASGAPAEFDGGAEGTSSEEPSVYAGFPEEAGAESEPEDEETPSEPGKGPRKVMLIDGIHPEEIRVAFVGDGILEYFEVENQRRKAFKGNIYKGKVVNVAQAIEAAFVEFGGGRHGFLPLNEYCGGALIENLGNWNEGDKRPHLRPGTEILVQVTKEESSIKGAALTSYISIAGRYLVMMLGMKRYGISKKITGEKERERIRKTMEKLDYPEHL